MSKRGKLFILLTACMLMLTPPAFAQLIELSEIQDGIFHISPRNMFFSSSLYYNDQYIDDDQAREFSNAARVDLTREVDGNYPFSVIDGYTLSSDLVLIDKDYCTEDVVFPFPVKSYLSRHNISVTQYTNEKYPPEVFFNVIKIPEPLKTQDAKIVEFAYFRIHNYENEQNEYVRRTYFPDANDNAYLIDAQVRVMSGNVAHWIHETAAPRCPPQPNRCLDCLPKSACKKPETIRLIRVGSLNPCIGEPFFPERPSPRCFIYPDTPENTTPAATNASYNYHTFPRHPNTRQSDPSLSRQTPPSTAGCVQCQNK